MRALVTLLIGSDYEQAFDRYCRPGWTAYAKRYGYDLIILNSALDTSARASARHICWQKNLILEQPQLQRYDQVAWIDGDIVINADNAQPIFDQVPPERIGAVDEFRIPDEATFRRALAVTYLRARRLGQSFVHNPTPQDWYRARGFPEYGEVVQGGMIVCSPHHHRDLLQAVYRHEDPGIPGGNHDMGALSYELVRSGLVTWLDYRFNRLVLTGLAEHLPQASRSAFPTSGEQNPDTTRELIARLYAESFFLHFAGCQPLMRHLA